MMRDKLKKNSQKQEEEKPNTGIEANVGDDSRETVELVDETPEISLQDLQKKINKLSGYITKTNNRIKKYEEDLNELTEIDPNLRFEMQNEIYGADQKSSMYIKI